MVDIIIPVFNTPIEDLNRCFDSILKQTFHEYIVYIIDDGSNEETKTFLDNYSNDKNNFIVKHIKNSGVSVARNIGIDISNSEYIVFIDSDDSIEETFLKEAYELIENNNLDLIIGGYNEIVENKVIRVRKCLPGLHIYDSSNLNLLFYKLLSAEVNDSNKEIADCPTGRIYTRMFKRNSIENLRFNSNVKISEDTLFMIDYMYKVNRVGIIDKIWYNYYRNSYSVTKSNDKENLRIYIKDFINEINKRLLNENDELLRKGYQLRIEKSEKSIKK